MTKYNDPKTGQSVEAKNAKEAKLLMNPTAEEEVVAPKPAPKPRKKPTPKKKED